MNKRKRYIKRRLTKAHKRGTLINSRLDSIITPSYQAANYSQIIQLQLIHCKRQLRIFLVIIIKVAEGMQDE